MVSIHINFTNRWLYTFALIIGIFALAVGVYAVAPNPGHTWSELGDVPSGLSDGDDDTRCDVSGTCSQVCVGADCRGSWPSGGGSSFPSGLTWGPSPQSQLNTGHGGTIELGAPNGVVNPRSPGTPFIDFHYGGSLLTDYNVRIINDADGRLTIVADVVRITGELVIESSNAPSTPSGVSASALSSQSILVTWNDNSNEDSYEVWMAPEGSLRTRIATLGANVIIYVNAGLDPGTRYTYRIRACNGVGCSGLSSTVSATTQSGGPE